MKILLKLALLVTSFSLINGCSSSDGGSNNADISSENAQDLAIAATESAKQSATSGSANPFSRTSSISPKPDLSSSLSQKGGSVVSQATSLGSLCLGGGSYSDNISTSQNSANATITFDQCDFGDGAVVNGTVSFSGNDSSFTVTYTNLTVTAYGFSETANGTVTCNSSNSGFTCTITITVSGIDGRSYSANDILVSGNTSSGYDVTATVDDPNHGTITIDANDVIFDCPAPNQGRPSTGTITFTSNGESGTVTFNSCSSYTVTFEGVSELYNW